MLEKDLDAELKELHLTLVSERCEILSDNNSNTGGGGDANSSTGGVIGHNSITGALVADTIISNAPHDT